MEMKKCKECGKLFTPKNPRQQYCDEKHYRPCPVCGKSIEIKYLSDPTPRCVECRKAGLKIPINSKIVNNSVETTDNFSNYEDYKTMTYVGRLRSCGFIPGHDYVIRMIPNRPYGYLIEAIKDVTENEDLEDVSLPIVNTNSYNHFFRASL